MKNSIFAVFAMFSIAFMQSCQLFEDRENSALNSSNEIEEPFSSGVTPTDPTQAPFILADSISISDCRCHPIYGCAFVHYIDVHLNPLTCSQYSMLNYFVLDSDPYMESVDTLASFLNVPSASPTCQVQLMINRPFPLLQASTEVYVLITFSNNKSPSYMLSVNSCPLNFQNCRCK